MTKKLQNPDEHATQFSEWLRRQPEIDSAKGFVATNIDFMWRNYKSKKWMLIEEKRYGKHVKFPQSRLFKIINKSIKDPNYQGFHEIVFENTSPEDGLIYLDGKLVTKEQLLAFLRFE